MNEEKDEAKGKQSTMGILTTAMSRMGSNSQNNSLTSRGMYHCVGGSHPNL